ncbi:MAG: guanine deaminase [Leptospira sp.]|nr:guanine deaminase [Leptospira sp.]
MKSFIFSMVICFFYFSSGLFAHPIAFRGTIFHFAESQNSKQQNQINDYEKIFQYWDDGLLIVENGKIIEVGEFKKVSKKYSKNFNKKIKFYDYRGYWIIPGFIDSHIHYPQMEMVGAYGEQLLDWLNTYTFPTERKYKDFNYTLKQSENFLDELLRNGTTSALVFATVHPSSVDAIFTSAKKRNMRLIAGKVMMDRNAPEYLLDTAESSYAESKVLIQRWHKKDRLQYAVTPRFAPTSSVEQLTQAGNLLKEFPSVYLHTHLSENPKEIEWVKTLFPNNEGYFDVYEKHGLTGNRSVFAHGVHLTEKEFDRISLTGSRIAFCPTSNLFLGSGLFPYHIAKEKNISVGIGTDVGAGTSFSMIRTMGDAYKIMQLQAQKLSSLESLYLITLGSARALKVDDKIGNFDNGKEADFLVIDPKATSLMKLRMENSKTIEEKLFVFFTLGDDRNIKHTYVNGNKVIFSK